MLSRYWIAPVSLFVFQVAPVGVKQDTTGKWRLAFGAALGSYEETSTDCEGNVLDRQKFKFSTVGGEVETWPHPKVRITAHAGNMSTDPDPGPLLADPYEGWFAGAMAAYEDEKLAAGVGLAGEPRSLDTIGHGRRKILPMLYVRYGRIDKFHGVAETGGPAVPGGPPELFRAGIGYRWGSIRRTGFRAMFGLSDFPEENGPSLDLMVRMPVSRLLDLGILGTYRDPHGGNIGVFGRVHWGEAK